MIFTIYRHRHIYVYEKRITAGDTFSKNFLCISSYREIIYYENQQISKKPFTLRVFKFV